MTGSNSRRFWVAEAVFLTVLTCGCIACAMAQVVYKCKNDDGSTAFSDKPCAANPEFHVIDEAYKPDPSNPVQRSTFVRPPVRTSSQQQPAANPSSSGGQQWGGSDSIYSSSNENGCPPGQIPVNASRLNPNRGWSSSKGYVSLRCVDRDANADRSTRSTADRLAPSNGISQPPSNPIPQNRRLNPVFSDPAGQGRVRDRNGNWYNPVPGVPNQFRDRQSGERCVLQGDKLRCN